MQNDYLKISQTPLEEGQGLEKMPETEKMEMNYFPSKIAVSN